MKTLVLIIFISLSLVSCKKQDEWLDKKSSKSDVVPTTLDDYQAILDNTDVMNTYYPSLGLIGADNYFISDASYNGITSPAVKNMYVWAPDIYEGSIIIPTWEWSYPYQMIEYSNIALEGINKINISDGNRAQWNNISGNALFFRAITFYNLAQIFCKPYDPLTSDSDLGIPLRLNADVNIKSTRSTVKQTYEQIINDLSIAETLLPEVPLYKTRASVPAVKALLAKTYLLMGDYQNALINAELALKSNSSLNDYNNLNNSGTYSLPNFKTGNPEIIFFALASGYEAVSSRSTRIVAPDLYNSYLENDLRKKIFFRGTYPNISFTGHQNGNNIDFAGIATNELFLVKGECQIRLGNLNSGLETVKELLAKRWNKNTTYQLPEISNEEDALKFILSERRKELPFTSNTRWEDLRRFNKDARFAKTLSKTVNGKVYSLPPNDPRYIYPIPPIEILKSNIEQNIR